MNSILTSATSSIGTLLENIPLSWASSAKYYFENEYREYWIATIEDEKLLITGLDINFNEITLTNAEVIKFKKEIWDSMIAGHVNMLKGTIINKCEALWILSVFESYLNQS